MTTKLAVPLTAPGVSLGGQITASLAGVSAVQITPVGPGEIGGPGVAVTLRIRNGSAKAISLDSVFVNLLDSAGNQALPTTGSPAAPLSGQLAPGKQAEGVYVFTISQSRRSAVKILVSDSSLATTVTFAGNA